MSKRDRVRSTVVAALATTLLMFVNESAPAQQTSQQDFADCQQGDDLARGIAACTRIADDTTQSMADRALAWRWLGNDHLAGNTLDDAIRAFGEAIKLDSRNATIYASRAIAELRKGDRAAATADYRKAAGLDAAKIGAMAAASPELKEIADAAASAPQVGAPSPPPSSAGLDPARWRRIQQSRVLRRDQCAANVSRTGWCNSNTIGEKKTCATTPVMMGPNIFEFRLTGNCPDSEYFFAGTTYNDDGQCTRSVYWLKPGTHAEVYSSTKSGIPQPKVIDGINAVAPAGAGYTTDQLQKCYADRHNYGCPCE